jgi:hypothetical protein
MFPPYDEPTFINFESFDKISEFLAPNLLLRDPTSGVALHADQVRNIDPGIVYDIIGTGFPFREKGLSSEQVWDKVFEGKSSLALFSALQKEDPGVRELPRVIRDEKGMDVAEWEAIYEMSDGCLIFLEAKYRMSKVCHQLFSMIIETNKFQQKHVNVQLRRMTASLRAMGRSKRTMLYLAAYYWQDDEDCIPFARNLGYGIIQPNGLDLTIDTKAKGMYYVAFTSLHELTNNNYRETFVDSFFFSTHTHFCIKHVNKHILSQSLLRETLTRGFFNAILGTKSHIFR